MNAQGLVYAQFWRYEYTLYVAHKYPVIVKSVHIDVSRPTKPTLCM